MRPLRRDAYITCSISTNGSTPKIQCCTITADGLLEDKQSDYALAHIQGLSHGYLIITKGCLFNRFFM